MTDECTVLDVLAMDPWLQTHADQVVKILGIDPNMPFEQFARWLRYGKKADKLQRQPDDLFIGLSGYERLAAQHWNRCLDAIKGDDQ